MFHANTKDKKVGLKAPTADQIIDLISWIIQSKMLGNSPGIQNPSYTSAAYCKKIANFLKDGDGRFLDLDINIAHQIQETGVQRLLNNMTIQYAFMLKQFDIEKQSKIFNDSILFFAMNFNDNTFAEQLIINYGNINITKPNHKGETAFAIALSRHDRNLTNVIYEELLAKKLELTVDEKELMKKNWICVNGHLALKSEINNSPLQRNAKGQSNSSLFFNFAPDVPPRLDTPSNLDTSSIQDTHLKPAGNLNARQTDYSGIITDINIVGAPYKCYDLQEAENEHFASSLQAALHRETKLLQSLVTRINNNINTLNEGDVIKDYYSQSWNFNHAITPSDIISVDKLINKFNDLIAQINSELDCLQKVVQSVIKYEDIKWSFAADHERGLDQIKFLIEIERNKRTKPSLQ